MESVKVCLESETIDSVIPGIFLILSIGTVYCSDAALYAFSSISQQIKLGIKATSDKIGKAMIFVDYLVAKMYYFVFR